MSQFELLDYAGTDARFEISCSKGTYIRSLIVDLGEALGCGAHVVALRRLSSGGLSLDQAVSLADLEAIADNDAQVLPRLLPLETLLGGVEKIALCADDAARIQGGRSVTVNHSAPSGAVALYSANQFIGVGELNDDGTVRPRRLLKH